MPSPAAYKYAQDATRAKTLREAASLYLRSSGDEKQVLYGASLAASVAAWDAYVNGIVRDFFQVTASPLVPSSSAHHQLAREMAESLLKSFNVPNSENVRNLLIRATGYDPWPDWEWRTKSLNSLLIRQRLQEIVKARHSIAHGFALPSFSWTMSRRGQPSLTAAVLRWNEAFLANVVRRTDNGIARHVSSAYALRAPW